MSKGAEAGTGNGSGEQRVIAIAMDGSEQSNYAFQYYVNDIRRDNDKVVIIHSVVSNDVLHTTQWSNSPYGVDKDKIGKLLEEEGQKTNQKLKQFEDLLKEAGIDGVVRPAHAESPGEAICKTVAEVNAVMVVMGTRGLGKIRRTFVGSVSDYVTHHCKVPVLICRK